MYLHAYTYTSMCKKVRVLEVYKSNINSGYVWYVELRGNFTLSFSILAIMD